jgi:hypothetical protein
LCKEELKNFENKSYPVYGPRKRMSKKTSLTVDQIDANNL